jgi:hypothetical protein
MSEEDFITVAVLGETVYIKPHGYAMQDNSLGIPDFLSGVLRTKCDCVVFDLEECRGMDSTFLGAVACAASAHQRHPEKEVVVINANDECRLELRRTGLSRMVDMHEEQCHLPEGIELRRLELVPRSEKERLEIILHLHEELAGVNEQNKSIYGPFVEMLRKDLQAPDRDNGR